MTDWVVQEDWYEVAVGDQVRVVRGDNVLDGKIDARHMLPNGEVHAIVLLIHRISSSVHITNGVWTLFVPAKPAAVLPVEPGWYLEKSGEAVYLAEDGYWTVPSGFGWTGEEMAEYGPFTRLEPVAVTAKKVIEFIDAYPFWDAPDAVRKEFGVTE